LDVAQLTAAEAADALRAGAVLVDVREDDEWQAGHAAGALHLPLSQIALRVGEIPPAPTPLVVVCRVGARSQMLAEALVARGRADVANLAGGMEAWAAAGLPLEPADGRIV
jgi:rhodanese-related sulfurtransferase